jgi:hypothetical protein
VVKVSNAIFFKVGLPKGFTNHNTTVSLYKEKLVFENPDHEAVVITNHKNGQGIRSERMTTFLARIEREAKEARKNPKKATGSSGTKK